MHHQTNTTWSLLLHYPYLIIFLISSIALLIFAYIKLRKYSKEQQKKQFDRIQTKTLWDAFNADELDLSERLKADTGLDPRLPSQYKLALKLIRAGQPTETIVQYCQLTQSEIELLRSMKTH